MKIAIHGGSGFMGYDFFRLLLEQAQDIEPIVYTSSPTGLTNLKRHDCDVRLIPTTELAITDYPDGVGYVVNFSHPFAKRHEMTPDEQIDAYVEHFRRALNRNPSLKLIHISTMSVYEPFARGEYFDESSKPSPPAGDNYARTKWAFEDKLRHLPGAAEWQLHLRPTVVYGPFCRPWTDNLLGAFGKGDVVIGKHDGRIQPISGRDVSRFLLERVRQFVPGVINIGGPELSWRDFFSFFQSIVDVGQLVQETRLEEKASEPPTWPREPGDPPFPIPGLGQIRSDTTQFIRDVLVNPSFRRMLQPIQDRAPNLLVEPFRRFVRKETAEQETSGRAPAVSTQKAPVVERNMAYFRPFFEEDRLVSLEKLNRDFPEFSVSPLEHLREQLREYHRFRFTDELFV